MSRWFRHDLEDHARRIASLVDILSLFLEAVHSRLAVEPFIPMIYPPLLVLSLVMCSPLCPHFRVLPVMKPFRLSSNTKRGCEWLYCGYVLIRYYAP